MCEYWIMNETIHTSAIKFVCFPLPAPHRMTPLCRTLYNRPMLISLRCSTCVCICIYSKYKNLYYNTYDLVSIVNNYQACRGIQLLQSVSRVKNWHNDITLSKEHPASVWWTGPKCQRSVYTFYHWNLTINFCTYHPIKIWQGRGSTRKFKYQTLMKSHGKHHIAIVHLKRRFCFCWMTL